MVEPFEELKRKIASLQEQWRGPRRENGRLRQEIEQLRRREKHLEQERERLREENERLKRQLEETQRDNKRQAAPFSRGTRKAHPQLPGRKPGKAYGKRGCKPIPEQVDEVIAVPPPRQCACGGALKVEKDRVAVSTGDRAEDHLAALGHSDLPLHGVPQASARA